MLQAPIFLVFASLISSSQAQVVYRRRRTSLGRVIAGAVVGGLALLFLLCVFMMLLRKRRARAAYAVTNPGAPMQSGFGGKPLFGGPWGRSNAGAHQNGVHMAPHGQQSSFNNNGIPMQQPHNPEYPSQNAPLPPPAYGKEGNYQAPAGPPPHGNNSDTPYAPPPGPPPAAHTTGQDNNFVGGFRS